jgi:hypothetical protein
MHFGALHVMDTLALCSSEPVYDGICTCFNAHKVPKCSLIQHMLLTQNLTVTRVDVFI